MFEKFKIKPLWLKISISVIVAIIIYFLIVYWLRLFLDYLGIIALSTILLIIGLAPTIIAYKRNHSNLIPIFITNIIVPLWGIALIWSFTDNVKKKDY